MRKLTPVTERFASIQLAAADRPHGTRARYVAGKCRCQPCRAANSRYQSDRQIAKKANGWNGLIDARHVRAHLLRLSTAGVGRDAVAGATDIPVSTLSAIRRGQRLHVRALAARKILDVSEAARADSSLVDAGHTWTILDRLIDDGYTRQQLAVWLGSRAKVPALQLSRDRITASTALKVARLARAIDAGWKTRGQ